MADRRGGGVSYDGSEPTVTVCQVCNQVLDTFEDMSGEKTLIHPRSWMRYDHGPVPIEVPASKVRTLCDFCGRSEPLWWWDEGSRWGACQRCGELLKNNDLEGLLDRALGKNETSTQGMSERQLQKARRDKLSTWIRLLGVTNEMVYIGPRRMPAKMHPRLMPKIQAALPKFWNNPNLRDSALHRRDWPMALPGFCSGQDDEFAVLYEPGDGPPADAWDRHAKHIVDGIWRSDLYWISSQFTQLSIMAGHDFEEITLTRDSLPSESGFVIWEDPIGVSPAADGRSQAAFRAATWTVVPGGIWICCYVQGDDADPDADVETMRRHLGWLICTNVGSAVRFNEETSIPDTEEYQFVRTFLATLFLINQPGVASVETAPVDKREARRYQRAHARRQPDVRLVGLRKQPSRSVQHRETGPRGPLRWREYRKGHWKQQPYGPKRGQRRPIYVMGYIAGPDGAPLRPPKAPIVKVLK